MLGSAVLNIFDRFADSSPTRAHHLLHNLNSRRFAIALARLVDAGVRLDVVYDIGANKGDWTRETRQILKNSQFVLFEASAGHRDALVEQRSTFFIEVLSSAEKDVTFYGDGGTGDSYYREQTARYENIAPQVRRAVTLDSMVLKHALPPADFIKLDTQGSELDILTGAPKSLSACSLVLLECPLVPYNVGAPNISDYIEFMRGRGFVPIELCEIHHRTELLVQLDMLFLRDAVYYKLFGERERLLMPGTVAAA